MKKGLIVIDMQNDFIDGALGTKEAQAIVPNVVRLIGEGGWDDIMVTQDTHYNDYLDTLEGKKLPVKHCIAGTHGWFLNNDVLNALQQAPLRYAGFDKNTFGSIRLAEYVRDEKFDEITLCGLELSICVLANAVLIRAYCPDLIIKVKTIACGDIDNKSFDAAKIVLNNQQIEVLCD